MNKLPIKLDIPESFYEEEVRWDFTVTKEHKQLWAIQLDLVAELLRVCNKLGIKIFASDGTLLGAIRHQGFIPWDDDMDFAMKRKDYDILMDNLNEFQHPYFLECCKAEKPYHLNFMHLRNSDTTGYPSNDKFPIMYGNNLGVFIDIFPLDNIPDDIDDNKKPRIDWTKRSYMETVRLFSMTKATALLPHNSKIVRNKKYFMTSFCSVLMSAYSEEERIELIQNQAFKVEATNRETKNLNTSKVLTTGGISYRERHTLDAKFFDSQNFVPFEMIQMPIPSGAEELLTISYGDWRTPVLFNTCHSHLVFDPYTSYKDYLNAKH